MGIALAVAGLTLGIAWLAFRYTSLQPAFELEPVYALLGTSYGVLLAIIVLFASQHYTDAIHHAEEEATGLNDVFKAVGTLEPADRDLVRHQIVCYAREKIAHEWPHLRESDGSGSPVVFARTRELNQTVEALARKYQRRGNLISDDLFEFNLTRAEGRQLVLSDSRPRVPLALWFVVFLGLAIIVFVLAVRYWHKPAQAVAALSISLLLLISMIGAIAELDRPFGAIAGIKPTSMETVLTAVVASSPADEDVLRPCDPPVG
jgi:hypothetical protein